MTMWWKCNLPTRCNESREDPVMRNVPHEDLQLLLQNSKTITQSDNLFPFISFFLMQNYLLMKSAHAPDFLILDQHTVYGIPGEQVSV